MMEKKGRVAAASALVLASLLGGCAGRPAGSEFREQVRAGDYIPAAVDSAAVAGELGVWERVAPVTTIAVPADSLRAKSVLGPLPPQLSSARIDVVLVPGATVADLVFALEESGVRVSVDTRDERLSDAPVPFTRHRGTLAELAERLESAAGISLVPAGVGCVVTRSLKWTFRMPVQQKEAMDAMKSDLEALGAKDVRASVSSAEISYAASPRLQTEGVIPYLERARANLATVVLQLALVTISADDRKERGVDWDAFKVQAMGRGGFDAARTKGLPEDSKDAFPAVAGNVASLGLAGIGGAGAFALGDTVIGVAGAIRWLDQIGSARTRQNVELRTLSGVGVRTRDGQTVPYVSKIGVAAISGTAATGGGTAGALGSVETAKTESGIDIGLTPRYDAGTGLVTVDVKVKAAAIVEMKELSAGTAVGSVTQPVTQDHQLESTVTVRAGEVSVIDGTRLSQLSSGSKGPLGGALFPHETESGRAQSLFVILRSAVVHYVPLDLRGTPR